MVFIASRRALMDLEVESLECFQDSTDHIHPNIISYPKLEQHNILQAKIYLFPELQWFQKLVKHDILYKNRYFL